MATNRGTDPDVLPSGSVTALPALPRSIHQMAFGHTESDVVKGIELLRRLIGPDVNPDHMWVFVHEGAPMSKSRVRFNRNTGRTYTPSKTAAAQKSIEEKFTAILDGVVVGGSVAIVAVFYRQNYQRIDADNLMKLVMDAGTRSGAWADDCYVTAQSAYIEMDRERPRTIVAFCQTESSLDRARVFSCQMCSKEFRRAGVATFARPPLFCSRECRYEAYRRDRAVAVCPRCQKEFVREKAAQRYCSRECGEQARHVRPPAAQLKPKPTCQTCGGPVSRPEYTRCVNCSPKGRKLGSKNLAKPSDGQ